MKPIKISHSTIWLSLWTIWYKRASQNIDPMYLSHLKIVQSHLTKTINGNAIWQNTVFLTLKLLSFWWLINTMNTTSTEIWAAHPAVDRHFHHTKPTSWKVLPIMHMITSKILTLKIQATKVPFSRQPPAFTPGLSLANSGKYLPWVKLHKKTL